MNFLHYFKITKLVFTLFFIIQFHGLYCQTNTTETDSTKYGYGKWGLGFDFGPCSGFYFLYGTPKNKIKCECIVNIGLIFSYKKMHYAFRYMPTEGTLQKSLDYGQKWEKGNRFQSSNFELAIGYELLNKKVFNIIPIGSVGLLSFKTRSADNKKLLASTKYHFSWSVGTAFDFKLRTPALKKNKAKYSPESLKYNVSYWYLRVLTGIYPTYFQNPFDMNGGLYYFSISIGGHMKPAKVKK